MWQFFLTKEILPTTIILRRRLWTTKKLLKINVWILLKQSFQLTLNKNRAGAIVVAEKMLNAAKKKTANKNVIAIYERVLHEFKIATDAEYEMLRKQIFGS